MSFSKQVKEELNALQIKSNCCKKAFLFGALISAEHDENNRILSTGYNGFPRGCSDDIFPWNRNESDGETKYPFVVHAELNAILNTRGKSLVGSRVYVGLFPCHECAKAIIQAGIKEVIFLSDKYKNTASDMNSRRMLSAAGVKLTKLETERKSIVLKFD